MREKRVWAVATAILAVSVLALSGCSGGGGTGSSGSGASAAPKKGGSLTVGIGASWVSLDPIKATTFNSNDVIQTIYEPLLNVDKNGKTSAGLAKSYKVSPDGRTYTLTLQTGVKFQDGTDFNAAAAKVNLDRYRDPKNACTCQATVKTITSVEAPSPDTLVVQLSAPDAAFPVMVLGANAGLMVSPTALTKYGTDYALHPVGTGPFQFDSQVSGNSVTVKRWDGYRVPDRPYLDSITFKVITDQDARYASLTSGAINVADTVSFNSVAPAKADSSLKLLPQGATGTNFVAFQVGGQGPLHDPKARAAACMAINTDAISKALFAGVPTTGVQSPFPVGSPYDPGKVPGYPSFNESKAKAAVKTLGGLSFDLESDNTPDNIKTAQALQSQWKAAGIDVSISQKDTTTVVQDIFAHKFQAVLIRWRGSLDPDGNVNIFFSSYLAKPDQPTTNYNLVNDPKVDELIAKARATTDMSKRKAAYKELSEQLASFTPYCYLWNADWYRVVKSNVYGIPVHPDNIMTFTDAYVNG